MIAESVPLLNILPPAILSVVAVTALLLCDYRAYRPGRYLFKPLAAAAFIWLALALDATASDYGSWLLAGLACCMAGDLLLMPDDERFFLAGLAAFLCGHLLYAAAFIQLPWSTSGLVSNGLLAVLLSIAASRWLRPHLERRMKLPVFAYTLVITLMLVCAGLTAEHAAAVLVIGGAWGFAISDLAVARQQFVYQTPVNGLWGTPLYFLSQMLLAASVTLA